MRCAAIPITKGWLDDDRVWRLEIYRRGAEYALRHSRMFLAGIQARSEVDPRSKYSGVTTLDRSAMSIRKFTSHGKFVALVVIHSSANADSEVCDEALRLSETFGAYGR